MTSWCTRMMFFSLCTYVLINFVLQLDCFSLSCNNYLFCKLHSKNTRGSYVCHSVFVCLIKKKIVTDDPAGQRKKIHANLGQVEWKKQTNKNKQGHCDIKENLQRMTQWKKESKKKNKDLYFQVRGHYFSISIIK